MTVKEMLDLKETKGYSDINLAELSGVPVCMIQEIFSGEWKNPTEAILQSLEKALLKHSCTSYSNAKEDGKESFRLEAPAAEYRASRDGFTLDDYYALPDERRVELIDGVFYDMAAPSTYHQLCIGKLYMQAASYIGKKRGDCIPFMSPVDIQLDDNNKTMVQPDFLIVCDPKKIAQRCIVGAPDFIVEVLSESTRKKDMILKLAKYREAGVREYWLIDLEKERVLKYFWEEDDFPHIFSANAKIPVGIYGGELIIDMDEIFQTLRTL